MRKYKEEVRKFTTKPIAKDYTLITELITDSNMNPKEKYNYIRLLWLMNQKHLEQMEIDLFRKQVPMMLQII